MFGLSCRGPHMARVVDMDWNTLSTAPDRVKNRKMEEQKDRRTDQGRVRRDRRLEEPSVVSSFSFADTGIGCRLTPRKM